MQRTPVWESKAEECRLSVQCLNLCMQRTPVWENTMLVFQKPQEQAGLNLCMQRTPVWVGYAILFIIGLIVESQPLHAENTRVGQDRIWPNLLHYQNSLNLCMQRTPVWAHNLPEIMEAIIQSQPLHAENTRVGAVFNSSNISDYCKGFFCTPPLKRQVTCNFWRTSRGGVLIHWNLI